MSLNKNMNEDLSFDEWFDLFQDEAKKLGYRGPIDKYAFEFDYEELGKTPEQAAKEFVDDLNL